jgi:hypothetical protein
MCAPLLNQILRKTRCKPQSVSGIATLYQHFPHECISHTALNLISVSNLIHNEQTNNTEACTTYFVPKPLHTFLTSILTIASFLHGIIKQPRARNTASNPNPKDTRQRSVMSAPSAILVACNSCGVVSNEGEVRSTGKLYSVVINA